MRLLLMMIEKILHSSDFFIIYKRFINYVFTIPNRPDGRNTDQRKGEIVIQSGDKSETVTVYQAGDGILSLTNKEFNLTSSEQDIAIEVSSNFEYEVTMPDVDWISEIQRRGILHSYD